MRADSLRNDGDGSEATEFYRANREAMDAGAIVAWPQRHNEDELSAIQHAMNLRLRDEAAFFAEYQNEPIVEEIGEEMLTAEQIAAKLNGYRPGEIPARLQPPDDVHRRPAEGAVLDALRVGGELHRLRRGLRHLARAEAGVLHAAGRAGHARPGRARRGAGRPDLRRRWRS